jgi:tyrosine-specific transport protein
MVVHSVGKARATRAMVGTMIGVGMLSLPYAVAQVGFVLGIIALVFVGVLSAIVLELYADLVLARGGKARFIHVVGRELGVFGTWVAGASFIGGIYGALLAYCISGGQLLRVVTFSLVPMTPFVATVVFFVLGALATVGGTLLVVRIQRLLLPTFLGLLAVLSVFALPSIHWSNFTGYAPEHLGAALGIMVFAFFGISSIPEARDFLGRSARTLPALTRKAVAIVAVVYTVFVVAVLGVTGPSTTESAIPGLKNALGHNMYLLATGIALLIVLSAFMNIATSLTNTYLYDLRVRFAMAWALTMSVPLAFVLFGTASISTVLNISGGVLASITGISMLVAYERARMSAELSKESLRVPQLVVGLAFCLFFAILVMTIVG